MNKMNLLMNNIIYGKILTKIMNIKKIMEKFYYKMTLSENVIKKTNGNKIYISL